MDHKLIAVYDIPDAILVNIASFLNDRELFGVWNRVCKLFAQIGMTSGALYEFNLPKAGKILKKNVK